MAMPLSKETFKIALGSLVLHHPGVNAPLYEASINQYVEELEQAIKDLEKEIKQLNKLVEEC